MTEADFHLQARIFLETLFEEIETNKILIEAHWDVDHLCYRADTLENYHLLKNQFNSFGNLLIASDVNGREISTYELFTPVIFRNWKISVVELPAPKLGKDTPMGFEHIEAVCDVPFSELIEKYGHLTLDTRGLGKDFNKELEICLGKNNFKFHHLSLRSVINVEKNVRVWNAILASKVLKNFSEHNPLIAGTFPLEIDVENSDVDVLLFANNLEEVEAKLKKVYGECLNFTYSISMVDGLDTLICNFTFQDVPFEIFAQARQPVRQNAYLHFLIEERLLNLGGAAFKKEIKRARLTGIKTEPAFAKILNIQDDPYKGLLELQKKDSAFIKGVMNE
jgi:predicted metalloenzyme YecM